MITGSLKLKFLILLFFLTLSISSAATGLFWKDWIETAVLMRDTFEKNNNLNQLDLATLDESQKSQILTLLKSQEPANNAWYYFYCGLMDETHRDIYFKNSLICSSKDPGTTWLQACSFFAINQDQWARQTLEQLEKLMFECGADQSTLISKQLLNMGLTSEKNGDTKSANILYEYAHIFNPEDLSITSKFFWVGFPGNINEKYTLLPALYYQFVNSWKVQLEIISKVYNTIITWFTIVAIVIAILLLIKYLPVFLHRIEDFFPAEVPLQLKSILSAAAFCSFSGFGLLPFLWTVAFLLFKHLSQKEKLLFSCTLTFMMFAPLNVHLTTIFSSAKNPDLSPSIFYRSVHEGFSDEKYKSIAGKLRMAPEDHLLLLTAANYALKNGNLPASSRFAEKAMSLKSDDPVVLVSAGNIAFMNNDIGRAEALYKQAVDINKRCFEAYFNLGQCHLRKFETTEGMELINKAIAINPLYLNDYIRKNHFFFSDSLPHLRQILYADYSPLDFWSKIAGREIYNGQFATSFWGTSFLGFSPWISFFISLALLITLLLLQLNQENNKIRTLFECRYCERKICKKCRSGTLCHACSDATRFVHNEHTLESIKRDIVRKSKFKRYLYSAVLNIVYPGTGALLEKNGFHSRDALLMVVSGLVYYCYYLVLKSLADTGVLFREHILLLVSALLFTLFFVIRYGIVITKSVFKFIQTMED